MWIKRAEARAFGCLNNQKLELAEGITLLWGPNESGKSTWHGAIFAALCGVRRGRGRSRDFGEFEKRFRPWDLPDWEAACEVVTDDGKRIEIRNDFSRRVAVARDIDLGTDVTNEIVHEGHADGSRLLGLNRDTFLAVASVRQAEITEITEHAAALREHLQRAAATAGVDATAATALSIIDDYIGSEIGTGRPSRMRWWTAKTDLEDARNSYDHALETHAKIIKIEAEISATEKAIAEKARLIEASEARRAQQAAADINERLEEARRLSQKYPNRPTGLVENQELIQQVTSAVHGWGNAALAHEHDQASHFSADEVDARLAELDTVPTGDLEPDPRVVTATSHLDAALRSRDFAATRAASSQPDAGDMPPLSQMPHAMAQVRNRRSPLALALGALSAASLAVSGALVATGSRIAALIAFAIAVGFGVAGFITWTRRPAAEVGTMDPARVAAEAARRATHEEFIRLAAAELSAAEASVEQARQVLVAALIERGVAVDEAALASSVLMASRSYEEECRQRRELSDLRLALETARRRNIAYKDLSDAAIAARIETEIPVDDMTGDELATALEGWLAESGKRAEAAELAIKEYERLERLLNGLSLQELEEMAREASEKAASSTASLQTALSSGTTHANAPDVDEKLLEKQIAELRENLGRSTQEREILREKAPSVPEAKERLDLAQRELERVEYLKDVLETAREFLAEAEEKIHRNVAPRLRDYVAPKLKKVTNGRYEEITVDPETLDVHVRDDRGYLRSASYMSHGTSEQVYLLLRLAMVDILTKDGTRAPILLDDVTVNSDPDRTRAVLEVLHEISQSNQVILFSQENEVREWAKSNFGPRDSLIVLTA